MGQQARDESMHTNTLLLYPRLTKHNPLVYAKSIFRALQYGCGHQQYNCPCRSGHLTDTIKVEGMHFCKQICKFSLLRHDCRVEFKPTFPHC